MVKQQKLNQIQKDELSQFMASADRIGAEVRRTLAVLYVDDEADESTIKRFTRFSRAQAFVIRKRYMSDGIAALKDKRKSNRPRILTGGERTQVITTLKTKQPKDVIVGCSDTGWSVYWLGEYVYGLTGKRYASRTSEYLLFREARLSFHLPGKRYEKADPEQKSRWAQDNLSRLQKQWRDPRTVVLCEDEMILTSSTTLQKVWLPMGEYPPVIETNSTRQRASFYGFLNLKTGKEQMFITERQNMFETVKVLKRIRKAYPGKKLAIYWDNCGWHRGSKVVEWIEQDGNTVVSYFPPYTPELNPQEHVWKAGRAAVTHNQFIGGRLKRLAIQFQLYVTTRSFDYELLGLRPGLV